MLDDRQSSIYEVQRLGPTEDLRIDIGRLSYGPHGYLEVVSADPHYQDYLASVVASVNATDELSIKVPSPAGAEPFSVYFMTATRDAPDLIDVMRQYLERKFDLILVPVDSD